MKEEHGNFERLVVGHVLGDLPDPDASRFRSHLLGCRDCRSRVAELRGIAADLADAERDELARARVRTETPRRVDRRDEVGRAGGQRISVRHVTVAAVVVVLLAAAMGFWNLHLRATAAVYLAVAEDRGDTLEALAAGEPLELALASGLRGVATADGERVALSLTGIQTLPEDEVLIAWFLGGSDGSVPVPLAHSEQIDDGTLAVTVEDPGGRELVITRESDPGDEPGGSTLLRAPLTGE